MSMSDDLRIPAMAGGRAPVSTSYRARRVGPPRETRALLLAAAALGGVLVVGMGGWALMGRRPAVVPVIEADSRPLRVRPDDRGGMQVAGAEEQVLGGAETGAARMAPAAEAPAPLALRAQMQPSPTPQPALQTAPSAVAAVVPPVVSPLPDTVRPAPRVATPVAPAPRAPEAGGTMVQLAAVETQAAATSEWARLAKRMPELLGERHAVVQRADRDGHAVFRVRTGGFADVAEATGFCTKVKAKGGACTIAAF